MYIKEIKIQGFKSFADKMTIELDPTFTGIVGPNGSGKSNIVDAVKWVLGEQSVKSLRGSSNMTDVIFNGSSSREPSSFASVCIIFDNTDRVLNVDYNEVSIKRIVYKTGENEYFINNDKCRLKDITNLFLDSRSSRESFNIIPQNKIDQILSEKSEDRRVIFEDAAGVLKYKKRKEECLSKLAKTHENIERINLIINENSENLVSLEEDARKAREYKDALNELENVEVSLIVKDITTNNMELLSSQDKKSKLEDELSKLSNVSLNSNTEIEKLKIKVIDVDDRIKKSSDELFKLNEALLDLSNKKTLMTERNKYDKKSDEVKNNIISLKEKEGSLNNSIISVKNDIVNSSEIKDNYNGKLESYTNQYNDISKTINTLNYELNQKRSKLLSINNKIDVIKENIDSMNKLPYSVKSIIGNPTLRGIHNIIANIIDTNEEYRTMINVALSASSYNIITDDEKCAKEAIEYLKRHNSGRATFFPLNVIKPKSIDPDTLKSINNMLGFIGVASELVTYDSKYYNIIMNQLGNIIVSNDINSAIAISKKINHKYKVISLDGEVIHIGGIMSGGSSQKSSSYISDKYELDMLLSNVEPLNNEIKKIIEDIDLNNKTINELKDKIYDTNIEIVKLDEIIKSKNELLNELNKDLESTLNEISNLSNDKLDKELDSLINDYYVHEQRKIELEKSLELLNKEKMDLNDSVNTLESTIKKQSSDYNRLNSEINSLDLIITKLNITLDTLLNRLSEDYSLGYEKAKNEYILEIDEKIARDKVSVLRRKIKSLGEVNLGAIEEFERVNKRVTFLTKQKDDLEKGKQDLLTIINDMDNVMESKFKETFENINKEFGVVFRTLFKGGKAYLKLTDPDNILETGIDIIAIPPGKNEKPLSLLSGGERTMTAISLLFSIMNLEHVPFVILDEVESALDENNATIFGEYLENYKNKTQLLIITHKKKTMEYLDKLYGVTMQESGVSKLVSVKLEN